MDARDQEVRPFPSNIEELPGVSQLTDAQFRCFTTLLFHTNDIGEITVEPARFAELARQSEDTFTEALIIFLQLKLITQLDATRYFITSWMDWNGPEEEVE